jgi:hypothetical protein
MNKEQKVELYRLSLTPDDILLLLDHLAKGMTDAKWRKDPKRAEAVYDLYQTVGQAMGEDKIVLEFQTSLAGTPHYKGKG